ncbi:MAG TPA: GNAT family N-acetyltransferase [Pyrinomonadaceae bacterium]|jgi:phosphinothricin acetyltransferase
MSYIVADMEAGDWEQVRSIYLEGIATGVATFETSAPTWEKWDASHLRKMRLVARAGDRGDEGDGGEILGWAALSPVSDRCVYGGVAEVSVYVGERGRGRGIGRALLQSLVAASERNGIWTLQAGVFPENAASIKLHLSCGFREVGRRERIGKLNGVWRDTLLLERRSQSVGAS